MSRRPDTYWKRAGSGAGLAASVRRLSGVGELRLDGRLRDEMLDAQLAILTRTRPGWALVRVSLAIDPVDAVVKEAVRLAEREAVPIETPEVYLPLGDTLPGQVDAEVTALVIPPLHEWPERWRELLAVELAIRVLMRPERARDARRMGELREMADRLAAELREGDR